MPTVCILSGLNGRQRETCSKCRSYSSLNFAGSFCAASTCRRSNSTDHILVEMAQEYVLVTLQGIPLHEEGVYRFRIALNRQAPVFVDVPILTAGVFARAE